MGWYAALIESNGSEGAAKAEGLYTAALRMNERDPLAMGNYAVFLHRIKRDHRVSRRDCRQRLKASSLYTQAVGACLSGITVLTCNDKMTRRIRIVHQWPTYSSSLLIGPPLEFDSC